MAIEKLKAWFGKFTEPVVERITAPLGMTFIIVWVFHNWKTVYSVFNFDTAMNLSSKIEKIEEYNDSGTCLMLSNDYVWIPLLWTFVALIGYFSLSTISLAVVTLYERWMRPFVFNLLNRNELISKEKHTELKLRMTQLQKKNNELEEQVETQKKQSIELENENEKLENVNSDFEKRVEKLNVVSRLFEKHDAFRFLLEEEADKKDYESLIKEFEPNEWIDFLNGILFQDTFGVSNGGIADKFLRAYLIEKEGPSPTKLVLTEKGILFYQKLIRNNKM